MLFDQRDSEDTRAASGHGRRASGECRDACGGIEIRRAKSGDVEALARLNKHLIEDERHPNPMDLQQLAQRMTDWLQGEYTAYLLLENGSILAYCLYRDDGDYYYMRHLFVDRAHRRKGIATQLLDWMYANVWTEKRVRLDVLSQNLDAVAFYRMYGFRVGCLRMEK